MASEDEKIDFRPALHFRRPKNEFYRIN